jgi:DNA-binding transcriptional ArsR family regulator
MGVTKTQNFTDAQNRTAQLAKALGHPARIAILQYLIRQQTCICGDLVDELPLAQATVSQHLKELKNVGLIKGEIEGTSVCYCINEPVWEEARHILLSFFNRPLSNTSCCN